MKVLLTFLCALLLLIGPPVYAGSEQENLVAEAAAFYGQKRYAEAAALLEPGFSNRELQDVLAGTKRKGKSKLFARFQRPSNHSR